MSRPEARGYSANGVDGEEDEPDPAPAGRLWEASIRKLTTIRRGASAFPAAVAGVDGLVDPAGTLAVASSSTVYQYSDSEEADGAAAEEGDDEEAGSSLGEPSHSEQLLPSGDFYQGDLRGDLPHGTGKFLWTDGSMYEGAWRSGRAAGRGKFSWPSGATYEGDLAGGYMHGQGTYIGEFGDTFAGLWANNLRHGRGTQAYANSDVYDGHWRDGLQDGHGRYIWRHGHEYIGTWKAGDMHGCGTVIWSDGDRYDGSWEDAKPKGQGTFRWSDGGMYIGTWCQESGVTHAKGVYYPPSGGPAVPVPQGPRRHHRVARGAGGVRGEDGVPAAVAQDTDMARGGGRAEEAGLAAAGDQRRPREGVGVERPPEKRV
ncbi:hypothetical protein ZWY2020_040267 [Hordeum vulgare]|nr:hypothetical protein ZWY2020_040267 [Hordeum vulgare]